MGKEGGHVAGKWQKESLDERGRNPVFSVAETLVCGGGLHDRWSAMFHEHLTSPKTVEKHCWEESVEP